MLRVHTVVATLLVAILLQVLVLSVAPVRADDRSANDLRDIRIGMAARELPSQGYADLACANGSAGKLENWNQWADCPVGPSQLRAIRFGYDPAIDREGTKVAGHPVILTLLVDDTGIVAGLLIATDPNSRLYMHKKAFLLGAQAKSRYGAEGWNCTERQPAADEQPVGGVYVNEQCRKSVNDRTVTIERRLFRHEGEELKNFTDETRISILAVKG
ncbi:hypothetical protein [Bradyrhizobium sp.]|jgi:hypothetical protein|uniref:hypothetical protein n=1 Tax=Bradyrhizobium sp. TaxID=376 RepID=UPI003C185EE9